jgi:hypothetical protein
MRWTANGPLDAITNSTMMCSFFFLFFSLTCCFEFFFITAEDRVPERNCLLSFYYPISYQFDYLILYKTGFNRILQKFHEYKITYQLSKYIDMTQYINNERWSKFHGDKMSLIKVKLFHPISNT